MSTDDKQSQRETFRVVYREQPEPTVKTVRVVHDENGLRAHLEGVRSSST